MQSADWRPPSLREAQERMASLILHPGRVERAAPEDLIAAPPRGDRDERLAVYVNGYPARVEESLEESFPAVAHLIGHRAMRELVARYVPALTRHSYNLNDVGAELASFLRRDPLSRQFPFLADLAQLEWAVARAFHAHEQAPLDVGPLATWTEAQWQHAVLRFQPSVALVCSRWPIRDLWEARETPIEAIDIDLRGRPDRVLVRRAGFDVECESLPPDEAAAVTALLAGQRLGEVTRMLERQGCDPAAVSAWFGCWMRKGMIAGCGSHRDTSAVSSRESSSRPG